jgi:hypothetical protein
MIPMFLILTHFYIQGAEFSINVVDKLTDKSLDLGTSIVRFFWGPVCHEIWAHFVCSIGMVLHKSTQTLSTVLHLLLNALSYRMRASCTNLIHWTKR